MDKIDYKKFDTVNTTACRWLMYNRTARGVELGLKYVNLRDKSHLWFIRTFCNYSTFSQNLIFTKNFIIYIYIKYILHVRAIRFKLSDSNRICFIEVPQFIKEVEESFGKGITEQIYNTYYRRSKK
ncbi:MAG: hypothetical protein LIR50_11610 [Bacillota bacterium]|nr:hypothetical protein [Bacillota bacterium]